SRCATPRASEPSRPPSVQGMGDGLRSAFAPRRRPGAALSSSTIMQVRELREGSRVAGVLSLRSVDVRRRREGEEYLKLTLANRTGVLPAVVLDNVAAARPVCRTGEAVHVVGAFSVPPPHGGRLVVEPIRRAEPGEYEVEALRDGPTRPVAQMEADL